MNPSAAILVGSGTVSANSGRRISGFDSEKSRRAGEASSYQASSFSTERKGVARTSSDMAGSLKGGLSSLLASPAVANAGLARSSGSDQLILGATLSSDQSSFDSTFHSRSFQSFGGLSITPRSVDKSPGSLAVSTTRMAAISSSPGTFQSAFSPLSELSSSHPAQARVRELRSGVHMAGTVHRSHAVLASSLHDAVAAALPSERSGPVLLQSRPKKPGQLSTPFLRSVGFALPGGSQHDATPMTPVSSSNQLTEHYPSAAAEKEQESEGVAAFPDAHGSYLNAIPSFSSLVEGGPAVSAADAAVRKPTTTEAFGGVQTSWLHSFPATTAQTSRIASQDRGSALMEGRSGGLGDVLSQREDILRLVESANGLKPPSSSQPTHSGLLLKAQEEHPVFNDPLVKRAFEFASAAHAGQVRKNGDPIISHCLETAVILAKIGGSPDVVAAGLLHDCLDDTPMTAQQLEASFGSAICELVKGVSSLSSLSQRMRDAEGALSLAEHERVVSSGMALSEDEVDRLRRMILSMGDVAVVLIKLADRLHNLRTISALPPEKQRRVASETLEVFAPLANRLGIWSWKAEIEDICFRTLWKSEHRELRRAVEGSHGDEPVLSSIAKLHAALGEQGVEFVDLHGRTKNLYSIFSKMRNKGKTLAEVFDRRGIRLIVQEERSCYEALEVVRRVWSNEKTAHFKDYIREPKGNGYQSIHVVVEDEDGHPLEVQIRTEAMHHAAEYGVAAHWHYKEKKGVAAGGAAPFKARASEVGKLGSSVEVGTAGSDVEEDSEEDVMAARQRVEWLRYVLSWVAELTDVKVRLAEAHGPGCSSSRPAGSSPGSAIGVPGLYRSPGSSPGSAFGAPGHSMCRFPEHAETCCFRPGAPAVAADSPKPPVPESEPLLVLLVESEKVSVKRLQSNRTRESFLRDYLADRGKLHLLHQASLLVNSELVAPSSDESFHIGDQLEVVIEEAAQGAPQSPASPGLGASGFEELQFGPFGDDPAEAEGEAADVVPVRFGRTALEGAGAEDALGMPSDLEHLEAGVLPGFAKQDDCSLALEFGRRKLAVAFGSSDNLLPELCSQNRGL